MKQSEIDRWMRRQARRDSQSAMTGINWVRIITVMIVGVTLLFITLRLFHVG